ncbi:MAG: hypothetical protein N3D20_02485 [Candidatus Pacearchaeota archaeon]|nr:hypothetical protein [Candidatus Pacearchaeota archaeon]
MIQYKKRVFANSKKRICNKKGLTILGIIIFVIMVFVAYVIIDLITRDSEKSMSAKNKQNIIIKTFINFVDLIKSLLKATGLGPLTWYDHIINTIAIIVAAFIFFIFFEATQQLFGLSSNEQNTGQEQNSTKQKIIGKMKKIVLPFIILSIIAYTLVVWIPFLRPLMLPLLTDYGIQLALSYEELIKSLLEITNKKIINYSSVIIFFKLIFFKGLVFGLYAYLLYLIPTIPEKTIAFIIRKYYAAKTTIEVEKARRGILETITGIRAARAISQQTREK